ncbi:Alkaline phosphatase H [Hypsizygus marmoreus]|uniref:alkaline phosphatase n=1 Tax=Hypsizygus marmoreus TaxID=39966 RepID=A0A369JWZ1_HYPMA|nr:Alkaline phosphatase H [Hypsizygus marmoreus]
MLSRATALLVCACVVGQVSAQTFKRLGGCPKLGCLFPPDQTDFLAGQFFDIRLEVHAPINGSEVFNGGVPDEKFTLCIQSGKGPCQSATKFFSVKEPALEKWTFSYYEDLFAQDSKTPTTVNVAAKAYRGLALTKPGKYQAKLKYYGGRETVANWVVREPATRRKAKNVLFFIGDGMTQAMITAARLIAHKSINGHYQSLMQMDQMDNLGHQMTHSLDSFITDSANSATSLYTGKKASVSALNVYADSSVNSFDDAKIETIAELFRRRIGGPVGMVSTAVIADATPAALCAHTRDRNQFPQIIQEYLLGAASVNGTIPWPTSCDGPDVVFGGGAENFIAGPTSPGGTDYYKAFQAKGYNVVYNNTGLQAVKNDKKVLGIFSKSNMAKWIDRKIYPANLRNQKNSPTGDGTDAVDQPGLKEMTLKAIDVLQTRQKKKNTGWFMMSEAASIDKMMHVLDYDRALGELLELDDTIRASIAHLKKIGEYENTLIVVTADHGHGFDVFGGADTKYLAAQTDSRKKRNAIGVYESSGLSGYTVAPGSLPNNDTIVFGSEGPNFPVQWNPRYTYAAGFGANPDHREGYAINTTNPRLPAKPDATGDNQVNPSDQPDGFFVEGTLPGDQPQGVHSLQDVSVFANGPGSEAFRGVYNSVDIFFKIADALALGSNSRHH